MIDIATIIGQRVKLKKAGNSLKGLCPFHNEKTPSFTVNTGTQRWHCFGCQQDGDAIDFLMRIDRLSFKKALEAIGGELPPLPSHHHQHPTSNNTPAVDPRPLLSAVWEMVSDAPWSVDVAAYLERRGIEPDAAWVVGCRDWSRDIVRIADMVRSHPLPVQEAAGFVQGEKLWSPLRVQEPALAVPVWRTGELYPWRWRWRVVSPRPGAPKSMSTYANGSVVDFLGAGLPVRKGLGGVVADDCYDVRAPRGSTVVLCEGEPDWLSAVDALNGAARVMSVCGGPRKWRDVWPSLKSFRQSGVKHILVCVHEGAAVDGLVGHGMALAEDIAALAVDEGITVSAALPQEGHDLNDMHIAGTLRAWFRDAGVTS